MATKRKADESPKQDTEKKKPFVQRDAKKREKLRFLLVGKTGSGKSSTGNTILGQPVFTTDVSFSSVTDQCQLRSAVRFDTIIDVMDCPGLFDTHSSDEDVASGILEALSDMDSGPDVIGYVIQIGCFTEEEFGAYRRFKAMLDDVTDHMVIIMTHGDRLKGNDVWNKLQQAPARLRNILEDCSHRLVVFDNSTTSRHSEQSQVNKLLREARKLKKENNHQPYILELDDDAEMEAEKRLLRVEKAESRRKAFVRKLIAKKTRADENLLTQRKKWKERMEEQEEAFRKREVTLKNRKKELSRKLKAQEKLNEELEEEIERMEEELWLYDP